MIGSATFAWLILAAFLVVGLIVHERTGARLGGVLVLPLLLLYALVDLAILLVFAGGALGSFLVGHLLYSRLLVYGRRLLYGFLLGGIGATMIAHLIVKPESFGLVLAVLPGLFAYNMHREGRYMEGLSIFMIWFSLLLVAATAVLWTLAGPQPSGAAAEGAARSLAFLLPGLSFLADQALHAVSAAAGVLDASIAGGVTLVAVASAADGGAE